MVDRLVEEAVEVGAASLKDSVLLFMGAQEVRLTLSVQV